MCEEQECWWAQLPLAAPRELYLHQHSQGELCSVMGQDDCRGHGEYLRSPVLGWVHMQEHSCTALPSHQPSAGKVDSERVPSLQPRMEVSAFASFLCLGRLMKLLEFSRTPCCVNFRLPVA